MTKDWWKNYEVDYVANDFKAPETYHASCHLHAAELFVEDNWNGECGDFTVAVREKGDEFTTHEVTVTVEPKFGARN